MNTLTRVKNGRHIKINGQDFMTYDYARSIGTSVTNKEAWIIEGVTYYMLTEGLVVNLKEEVLGVGA
jgi:hypothetical protein